jgi:hypothetical protein
MELREVVDHGSIIVPQHLKFPDVISGFCEKRVIIQAFTALDRSGVWEKLRWSMDRRANWFREIERYKQEVPAQEKMDMRPPYADKTLTDPPPLPSKFPTP